MNNLKLIIDQRERELKTYFENKDNVLIETLDIGDIMFSCEGEIVLIIERKTVSDLGASICDGRSREQKARLLGSGIHKDRIMYIVEGDLTKVRTRGVTTTTLMGSIINTQFRDGIKVYKTLSLNETITFIEKVFDKLKKDGTSFWQYNNNHNISASEYSSTLKTKKKANMTPEVWLNTQLTLIPQVTDRIASEIVQLYPTISILVKAYADLSNQDGEAMLEDITYVLSSGKNRRVGPKISTKIYNFIHGVE